MILVTASAFLWSTAGLLTRLIGTDTWTLVLWRSVFGALFQAAVLVWQERRGTLRVIGAMGTHRHARDGPVTGLGLARLR